MLDMAFNLGSGALKNKWTKLNKDIDVEDWADAAEQCERPGANAVRNTGTKELFTNASEDDEE